MELLTNEVSHSDDCGVVHLPSALDITDRSMKIINTHPTVANHHHQSVGRSIFLKRSRNYYGHQYSRRNSTYHANAPSSSRGKEYREKVFSRPERIRSSSLDMDAISPNKTERDCGICEKLLSRKINYFGSSTSCCELSVVAILVCGHVYHANCLEQRTRFEERRDPPCPVCASLLLQDLANKSQ